MSGFSLGKVLLDDKQVVQLLRIPGTRVSGKDRLTTVVLVETTTISTVTMTDRIMADKVVGNKILIESAIPTERCQLKRF